MSNAVVCIPWRPRPDRLRAYRRVRHWWEQAGFPVVVGDSDPAYEFNRSQARNNAVRAAKAEVVIVFDADTLPQTSAIDLALDRLAGEVIWPFSDHRIIDPEWLDQEQVDEAPRTACHESDGWGPVLSASFVCRTETYWRLGGFDERFTDWGGEDTAFACAAATLSGGYRIPGLAASFNHSVERGTDKGNMPLRERYREADGKPKVMEALISEPERGVVASGVAAWKARWPSPEPGVHWI